MNERSSIRFFHVRSQLNSYGTFYEAVMTTARRQTQPIFSSLLYRRSEAFLGETTFGGFDIAPNEEHSGRGEPSCEDLLIDNSYSHTDPARRKMRVGGTYNESLHSFYCLSRIHLPRARRPFPRNANASSTGAPCRRTWSPQPRRL